MMPCTSSQRLLFDIYGLKMVNVKKTILSLFLTIFILGNCHADSEVYSFDTSSQQYDWLKNNCISITYQHEKQTPCRVNDFEVVTKIEDTTFLYASYFRLHDWQGEPQQESDKPPFNNQILVLFESKNNTEAKPIMVWHNPDSFSVSWLEKPTIISGEFDLILRVPHSYSGTGHFNSDKYFVWKQSQWQKLNTENWFSNLNKQLPEGYAIWKGIVPNIKTMTAQSLVWKKGDANCCPSGGNVDISFGIAENELIINTINFIRAE